MIWSDTVAAAQRLFTRNLKKSSDGRQKVLTWPLIYCLTVTAYPVSKWMGFSCALNGRKDLFSASSSCHFAYGDMQLSGHFVSISVDSNGNWKTWWNFSSQNYKIAFRSLVLCCLAYHLRSRLNYSYRWSQLFPAGISSSLTCLSLHLNQ